MAKRDYKINNISDLLGCTEESAAKRFFGVLDMCYANDEQAVQTIRFMLLAHSTNNLEYLSLQLCDKRDIVKQYKDDVETFSTAYANHIINEYKKYNLNPDEYKYQTMKS